MLAVKGPTSQTEELYISSINRSLKALRLLMTNYDRIDHYLTNRDLDTGSVVKPGGYPLTDRTYAQLLAALTKKPTHPVPIQLKHDIENFYADPLAPITTKKIQSSGQRSKPTSRPSRPCQPWDRWIPFPDEILDSE